MDRDNGGRPARHRPYPAGHSARCVPASDGGGLIADDGVSQPRGSASAGVRPSVVAESRAGETVLRIEHVRRHLGRAIHDATRTDLASRVAVHQAFPIFTRDLVELAEDRTVRIDRLDAAAQALSRHARSRDATMAERQALRDAWAALEQDAIGDSGARAQAQARAWRQIERWRLSDAFTLLSSIIPARYAFADGVVRPADIAGFLDVLARERNQTRLRDVAATLRDAPMPLHEGGRETLIDALGAAFGIDLEHRPSVVALRASITNWSLSGSLANLGDVLSAAFLAHVGSGPSGVSALGEALARRHGRDQRLTRAEAALLALSPLRTLSLNGAVGQADLFRIVYALYDALRDADGLPSSSVDTIWRQCETWRAASLLPLLPVALSYRDFFLDGRLRLADVDAHLRREYRLLRSLQPDLRARYYPQAYREGSVEDASVEDAPWLVAFDRHADTTDSAAMHEDLPSRTAERQFRLLEIILLRETTTAIGQLHLRRGLRAFRHSHIPAMCNRTYSLEWYETVLVDPVVAPFNTQIVAIVEDMIVSGVDLTPSPVDWIALLAISPNTLERLWRQRECFSLLTHRYYSGLVATQGIADSGPVLGIDSFAMFSSRLGDRRARALLRWVAMAHHRLLTEEPPDVLLPWIDLLLDDTISDAALDSWLSGLPDDAFQGGTPSAEDARSSMRRFEATGRFQRQH